MSTVVIWHIKGKSYQCERFPDVQCPLCGHVGAIVSLPPPVLEKQPDGTTHVCHPAFNGCNHGFAFTESQGAEQG